MFDSDVQYQQECLARYLLGSKKARGLYFKKNPKRVDHMVNLMRQEQAKRLAAMTEDDREDWFNRQRYLANNNLNRQRYLVDVTKRLQLLLEKGKTTP